ncbi:hypothetical protein [Kordiimonas marina]|uniref:hypothetical protein n=1 Tax=Kordiimonas marina TaxID=2872312 RepID=UPI001FF35827|nr:hypothetical protein [Kordiimonas marina]MCJ9430789.1 hypothetical protein [Kordiimonas marina]
MKIYLHIGTHKTGTTAIQHYCLENRDRLLRHGIFWPDEQLPRHLYQHSYLAQFVRDGNLAAAGDYIGRAVRDAEAAGATSLLLSGEGFSQLEDDGISAVFELLNGHEVEVIVYFRNIRHYAISMLHQRLKSARQMPDLSTMLEALRKKLNYTDFLKRWEASAGASHVTVRCYDQEKNRLYASFLDILGLPADALPQPSKSQATNRSLDLATQLMLAASGANYQLQNFKYVRADYQKVFDAHPFFAPGTEQVAEALCAGAELDLSHPKLAPYQDLLLAPLHVPSELGDPLDYLNRLGKLLRRSVRHERWRRRYRRLKDLFLPSGQDS